MLLALVNVVGVLRSHKYCTYITACYCLLQMVVAIAAFDISVPNDCAGLLSVCALSCFYLARLAINCKYNSTMHQHCYISIH